MGAVTGKTVRTQPSGPDGEYLGMLASLKLCSCWTPGLKWSRRENGNVRLLCEQADSSATGNRAATGTKEKPPPIPEAAFAVSGG